MNEIAGSKTFAGTDHGIADGGGGLVLFEHHAEQGKQRLFCIGSQYAEGFFGSGGKFLLKIGSGGFTAVRDADKHFALVGVVLFTGDISGGEQLVRQLTGAGRGNAQNIDQFRLAHAVTGKQELQVTTLTAADAARADLCTQQTIDLLEFFVQSIRRYIHHSDCSFAKIRPDKMKPIKSTGL